MRILGLDVGSKTIGLAVSDELGLYAHPVRTLSRLGTAADVAQIQSVCAPWNIHTLVVGLPYTPTGEEGKRAERVRVLGDALVKAGYEVVYQDEQFSTVQAEEHLLFLNRSRQQRKRVIDQAAAVVILQEWLDARSHASSVGSGAMQT